MSTPASEPHPTREEFLQEVVDALRAAGLQGEISHDEVSDRLVHAVRGAIDLRDAYQSLSEARAQKRASMLAGIARGFVNPPAIPETWEAAKGRVLPSLRSRMSLMADDVRRQRGSGLPPTPTAEITQHLVFVVALPTDHATFTISMPLLERWGVGMDVVFQTALLNLRARSDGRWATPNDAPGVFVSMWQDGFDASRIFFPALLAQLPLKGKPVAVATSPSRLLVAGADDEEGLFNLGRVAKREFERTKSFFFFRPIRVAADGESWEDGLPPKGHGAYDALRLLQALNECADYHEHGYLVQRAAEGKGEVMALPPLDLVQSMLGGEPVTFTRWTAGKAAGLPKADAVIFQRGEETLGYAFWDEIVRALPDALKELPGYPTRYLAADFPEDWQLAPLELKPWTRPAPP